MSHFSDIRRQFVKNLDELADKDQIEIVLKEFNRLAPGKLMIKNLINTIPSNDLIGNIVNDLRGKYFENFKQYLSNHKITIENYDVLDLFLFDIAISKIRKQNLEYASIRFTLISYFLPCSVLELENMYPEVFPMYILYNKDDFLKLQKMAELYEVLSDLINTKDIKNKKSVFNILFEDTTYEIPLENIHDNMFYNLKKFTTKAISEELQYLAKNL